MNEALARAATGGEQSPASSFKTSELRDIVKKAVNDLTDTYTTAQSAEIMRKILFQPEREAPNQVGQVVEVIKAVREINKDSDSDAKGAASIYRDLYQDTKGDASESKKALESTRDSLNTLLITKVIDDNKRAIDSIVAKVNEGRMSGGEMGAIVTKLVERSIDNLLTPQAQRNPLADLLGGLQGLDGVMDWVDRRRGADREVIIDSEVRKEKLQDERERFKIQLDAEHKKLELEQRRIESDRKYGVVQQIISVLPQALQQALNGITNRGTPQAGGKDLVGELRGEQGGGVPVE